MKIQHKLTWVSSVLFGVVFFMASVIIYTSFYQTSKKSYFKELAQTAKIAGMFYLEEDELTPQQFKPIKKAFDNLNPEQGISLYDEQGRVAFDTKEPNSDFSSELKNIRHKGQMNFKRGKDYFHGLFYRDNQGDFVVLVKAKNPLLEHQLNMLLLILSISFIIGMLIIIGVTSHLARLAYKPVRNTIQQVNTLNLNQRPLQLRYDSTQDELEELFEAFNGLLHEIEETYQQQKNFVDYASHELKTPLAGIISQLEINHNRQRYAEDYQKTHQIIHKEALQLRDILKNLLTFSSLNRTVHQKKIIRIDELLWNIIEKLSTRYEADKFQIDFQIPPEEMDVLEFKGNETLLQIALFNLIENAAKFSENSKIKLTLLTKGKRLQFRIEDRGIGMSQETLHRISQPFYRGGNVGSFEGSGLGTSISIKILDLHKIDFEIESEERKGTCVSLEF